jgi:hypothetical protein
MKSSQCCLVPTSGANNLFMGSENSLTTIADFWK